MVFCKQTFKFRAVFAAEGHESDSWETMFGKQRRAEDEHWLIGRRPLLTHAKQCAKENYIFRHMLWKYIRFQPDFLCFVLLFDKKQNKRNTTRRDS